MSNKNFNLLTLDFLRYFQGVQSHSLFSEFVAVLSDIKPVLRTYAIRVDRYPLLKKICAKYNLKCEHSNFRVFDDTTISTDNSGHFYVYISKEEQLAKEAKKVEEDIITRKKADYESHLKFSHLMGYPECCFNFFFNKVNLFPAESHMIEFEAYKNTKKFSFYLNNLIRGDHYLISHYPCTYNCRKSIQYAKSVLKSIEKIKPALAIEFKKLLKYPVVKFLKVGHYLRLIEGEIHDNTITYSDCWDTLSFDSKFKKGNKIEVHNSEIKIFRDSVLIDKYKKENEFDGVVFPFR
ncbi:MAG: hypothetical protein QW474_00190 [Candidatus Aenigmatarchaeota archaeon]